MLLRGGDEHRQRHQEVQSEHDQLIEQGQVGGRGWGDPEAKRPGGKETKGEKDCVPKMAGFYRSPKS